MAPNADFEAKSILLEPIRSAVAGDANVIVVSEIVIAFPGANVRPATI